VRALPERLRAAGPLHAASTRAGDSSDRDRPPQPAGERPPGTILRYTITLANSTRTTITLRPCPGYSEGIYASGLVVRRWFALNCDTVHKIGPHQHVRYAMQLTIPPTAPAGIAKLGWSLNTPNGPAAGRVIRITHP
jgi:hypothetical protein